MRDTSSRPSVPGMLKSTSAISTEPSEMASRASSALVASVSSQSGRIRRKALDHHHAGELAVVDDQGLDVHVPPFLIKELV